MDIKKIVSYLKSICIIDEEKIVELLNIYNDSKNESEKQLINSCFYAFTNLNIISLIKFSNLNLNSTNKEIINLSKEDYLKLTSIIEKLNIENNSNKEIITELRDNYWNLHMKEKK
jgi:hypothetical protein